MRYRTVPAHFQLMGDRSWQDLKINIHKTILGDVLLDAKTAYTVTKPRFGRIRGSQHEILTVVRCIVTLRRRELLTMS